MLVADVRRELKNKWLDQEIVYGRGGNTIELIGASFVADETSIFGKPNEEYIDKELMWYNSQSLNINDFPGDVPSVWQLCCGDDGAVNSNYGWCLYSEENGNQRQHVIDELQRSPHSRRAVAIYTRPSMHVDATKSGKQDFLCTNAVEYFLRNGKLDCVVQMRSSDAVLGYRNDLAWQQYVLLQFAATLNVAAGQIVWQAGSLHVYERHFKYLEAL